MKIESSATTQVLASLVEVLQKRCQENPTLPGSDIVVDLVVLISSADGQIDEIEQSALRETIQLLSGGRLQETQLSEEITACVADLSARGSEEQARRLGGALSALQAQKEGLRLGAGIALVSRGVSAAEHSILVDVAKAAGISSEQLSFWLKEVKQLIL